MDRDVRRRLRVCTVNACSAHARTAQHARSAHYALRKHALRPQCARAYAQSSSQTLRLLLPALLFFENESERVSFAMGDEASLAAGAFATSAGTCADALAMIVT
eukprot:6211187-Pleurochrysis_carterae.AAC.4